MKILVLYATTDGQTRKVARHVAYSLADKGHGVELLDARDTEGLELSRFDRAVLGGSLHVGAYQKPLADFVRTHAAVLNSMPTLFLPLSLAAAGDDAEDWEGLRAALATFLTDTGWTPGRVAHVAGAFRFSEYDFFRAWMMRRIAAQKDETVDPHKDKEYTDWAALDAAVAEWLAA